MNLMTLLPLFGFNKVGFREWKPTDCSECLGLRICILEPVNAISICPVHHGEDLMTLYPYILQVLVRH